MKFSNWWNRKKIAETELINLEAKKEQARLLLSTTGFCVKHKFQRVWNSGLSYKSCLECTAEQLEDIKILSLRRTARIAEAKKLLGIDG
jgi:hypothetical protein